MKKEYEKPQIDVVDFQSEDVMLEGDGGGSVIGSLTPDVEDDF